MRFIKENIFYVILAGILLVVICTVVAVGIPVTDDIEKRWDKREGTHDLVQRNRRWPQVNQDVVDQGRGRLERMKAQARCVAADSVRWNSRNYKVLMLPKFETGRVVGEVRAFPIDRRTYRRYGLRFEFTRLYLEKLKEMIAKLEPTSPPTDSEIEAEIADKQAKLEREAVRERRIEEKGRAVDTAARGRGDDSTEWREADVAARAKELALKSATLQKATGGLIYIEVQDLDVDFPEPRTNPSDADLWAAQWNLWVTQDVLEAIKQTNNEALRAGGTSPKKHHVMNAAVKRLVSLEITTDYVAGQEKPGRPTYPVHGGAPFGAGGAGPSRQQAEKGNLTQRVSTKLYDVIHYKFSVIMPMRYLQALQKNLENLNYHTILNVQMEEVVDKDRASKEGLYYYGTDPVMKVTFDGELLLLTDWQRGKWDDQNNSWSKEYPPLVPLEVLMQRSLESALRDEDKRRIREQSMIR